MNSTITIDVSAPPELVFALARDVERWELLLPHYARSRRRESNPDGSLVVDFVARRPLPIAGLVGMGIPVTWRSRTWSEAETLRLRFLHIAGATRGMDVTWRIDRSGDGARVSIDHDFRPRIAPVAPIVDRFFTRSIAGRTLATFKALAEAIAQDVALEPRSRTHESEAAVGANQET